MNMKISEGKNILLFLILCLIGGTTYAFQKLGLAEGLPLWSAGMRFILAGIIMLCYVVVSKKIIIDRNTMNVAILYGIFYFALPFGCIYWVGQFLPSGLLSVLSASVSVFSVIFSFFLKNERATRSQIIGIVFSMIGIVIIFMQSFNYSYDISMLLYLMVAILAYVGAAYSTAFLKSEINKINQLSYNTVALLTGGIILCLASFLVENGSRAFYGNSLLSLLYLAIVGSMCSTRITTYLMGQWHISKVTAYRFISPVISLLVGFLFLNEILTRSQILGVFFIIIGTFFINKLQSVKENNHC